MMTRLKDMGLFLFTCDMTAGVDAKFGDISSPVPAAACDMCNNMAASS